MNEWKAIVGRVTLFPASSAVPLPSALELFKKLWKNEPTTFQGGKSPLSGSIAQGTREELGLTCAVHPSRIDLTLSSTGREDPGQAPRLFVVDDGEQLHQELLEIIATVGRQLLDNPVVRVAIFLQVVLQTDNSTETNKVLASILPTPYKVKLSDEEEFILQIGRPRQSKRVQSAILNRLTKWSGDRFQTVSVQIPVGTTPLAASPAGLDMRPAVNTFFAASVSFDINNVPVKAESPLTSDQQSALLFEALEEARTSVRELRINVKGLENG